MLQKIKSHWKEILFMIVALFALNKCTQSCNRQNTIETLEKTVLRQDSTINFQTIQIKNLQRDTTDYINQLRLYKGFTNEMSANIAKQNEIAEKNAKEQEAQRKQTEKLIKDIKNSNK